MGKKDRVKELIVIFWLFIIGSIAGYIFEMTVVLFQKGYFETRKGLIYGPFIQVYGMGIVVYHLILSNITTRNKLKIFGITAVLGGVTEYIFSYAQEKIFGTISWDYSYLTFNLNGRTSLLHCSYWGIGGLLYVKFLEPFLEDFKSKIDKRRSLKVVTTILATFMVFDILISWMAMSRQTERKNNILPANSLDVFLDNCYPDEYLDKIYTNKKEV